MKEKAWAEVVRRVGVEGDGTYLTVGPWSEAPEYVSLYTEGDKNKEWFGSVSLSFPPDLARRLGYALIACAEEVTKE